jgi:hypothetical protein
VVTEELIRFFEERVFQPVNTPVLDRNAVAASALAPASLFVSGWRENSGWREKMARDHGWSRCLIEAEAGDWMDIDRVRRYWPETLSVVRVVVGLLFLEHGSANCSAFRMHPLRRRR